MGLHFADIRNVIHWGTPTSAIQYWQQAACTGCDNLTACQSYHHSDEYLDDMVHGAKKNGNLKCAPHFLLCNLLAHEMPRPYIIHDITMADPVQNRIQIIEEFQLRWSLHLR